MSWFLCHVNDIRVDQNSGFSGRGLHLVIEICHFGFSGPAAELVGQLDQDQDLVKAAF